MISPSLRHQDSCSHMPLGVFLNNELVATVEPGDHGAEGIAEGLAAQWPRASIEILQLCRSHPDVAAVDCVTCVPLEVEK